MANLLSKPELSSYFAGKRQEELTSLIEYINQEMKRDDVAEGEPRRLVIEKDIDPRTLEDLRSLLISGGWQVKILTNSSKGRHFVSLIIIS